METLPIGRAVLVTRWAARVLGLLLLARVVQLLASDWPRYGAAPPLSDVAQFLALLATLGGFVVLWWCEGLGGLVSIGGMLGFCGASHVGLREFPPWWFAAFYVPGVLAIASWWLAAARADVGPVRALFRKPVVLIIVLVELGAGAFLGALFAWEAVKPRSPAAPVGVRYRPKVLGGPVVLTSPVLSSSDGKTYLVGDRDRGYLGIVFVPAPVALTESLGIDQGIVVTQVLPGSAAEASGVLAGDIVVGVDGSPVASPRDLTVLCAQHTPGQTVRLHLARREARTVRELTADVVLMSRNQMDRLHKRTEKSRSRPSAATNVDSGQ